MRGQRAIVSAIGSPHGDTKRRLFQYRCVSTRPPRCAEPLRKHHSPTHGVKDAPPPPPPAPPPVPAVPPPLSLPFLLIQLCRGKPPVSAELAALHREAYKDAKAAVAVALERCSVILQALAETGLAPNRLELEITESLFIENPEATLASLQSLRALGVRVALDDFGTGYSSLSYLRSFPFDKIKIDRSFIIDLLNSKGATAIIKSITTLAEALGMETTAEGVESAGQLDILRQQGCSHIQGYYFSRPIVEAAVAEMLSGDTLARRAAG